MLTQEETTERDEELQKKAKVNRRVAEEDAEAPEAQCF